MKSMRHYIDHMGNKSFDILPFNEVDIALLCELSYVDFKRLTPHDYEDTEPLKLSTAHRQWSLSIREEFTAPGEILRTPSYEILELIGETPRFRDLTVHAYREIISVEEEIQFSAMIYSDDKDHLLLVFRGTDFYSVGWKEDFKMSYLPIIPSQELAKEYLTEYFKQFQHPITIAGHSKGGNLAVYSAIACPRMYHHLILDVYNFDGPGFAPEVLGLESYEDMKAKVHTYLPQDSFVGMLLDRLETPAVVQSSRPGILGHFTFNWEIHQEHFIRTNLSTQAEKNNELMTVFLNNLSMEERMEFVDRIFSLISPEDHNLILGTAKYNAEKLRSMFKYMKTLSHEDVEILKKVIFTFRDQRKKYYRLPFPLFLFFGGE